MKIMPASILFSAVLTLTKLISSSATVDYHDYNTLLNKGLDQNIFPYLGVYGVRYTVANDSPFPPPGCQIEVVDSLERHGARLMTSNALISANATLVKIKDAIADISTSSLPSELRFFKTASLLLGTSSLVPYGALQAYYSGKSSAAVYSTMNKLPPFVRASGDEASQDDRVILTSQYWSLGFTGEQFPSQTLITENDVRRAASSLPKPNVIFSELAGINNTLDVSTCTKYNNVPSSQGENGAQAAFENSTILPILGARLSSRFAAAGVKGLTLTGQDLLNLAEICSFDTLGRASVSKGQLSLKQSKFCGVYNSTEWPIVGYAFDVGKWKGEGYGTPYFKALGTGFLRELVARFNGTAPSIANPTSLNTTIDGNSATFPLPNREKGPVIYFDGSHDNNMAPIVASLGLFNGPNETTGYNSQNLPHNWVFSQIAPLQGKIVFEKLSCEASISRQKQDFVRIRANEAILTGWCNDGSNYERGTLCPMHAFLKNLAFVENATQWNTCYD